MKTYNIIGIMSGTSLDGLDIAYCKFSSNKQIYQYEIINAKTIKYNNILIEKLKNAHNISGIELTKLDIEYGKHIGQEINHFIKEFNIEKTNIDSIASHGHTIFHNPKELYTLQIGNGAAIAATTNINTICDFRTKDVILGGEGAPLVPIGDQLLFHKYNFCLNIGGIANISFLNANGERIAFDICAANIVLNNLANKLNLEYDNHGKIARSGKFNKKLFDILNDNPFYSSHLHKSLGREWIETNILNLLENIDIPIEDIMNTFVNHIAFQISKVVKNNFNNGIVTGGGAYNKFLIEQINEYANINIIVPDNLTIDFKEAIIFGLLALLWIENKPNCLKSVTNAYINNIGGALYKSH